MLFLFAWVDGGTANKMGDTTNPDLARETVEVEEPCKKQCKYRYF